MNGFLLDRLLGSTPMVRYIIRICSFIISTPTAHLGGVEIRFQPTVHHRPEMNSIISGALLQMWTCFRTNPSMQPVSSTMIIRFATMISFTQLLWIAGVTEDAADCASEPGH